jgi:hypothetical protein
MRRASTACTECQKRRTRVHIHCASYFSYLSPLFRLIYTSIWHALLFTFSLVYRPSSLYRMLNPRPRMCLRWSRRQTPQSFRQENPGPTGPFPVICGRPHHAHPR